MDKSGNHSGSLCRHQFFSRHGGKSKGVFSSLNVSGNVGDDPDIVVENRRRLKSQIGCDHLVSACQVHGDKVYLVGENPGVDFEVDGFDALITSVRSVALMVQLADCQGVLLYDPVKMAVAAIHCGWRGSVARIIGKTVAALKIHFNTEPSNLLAYISPSLGPCCAEFVNYRVELPEEYHSFQVRANYFDFWEISKVQLVQAGLNGKAIENAGICTSCSEDYFSYRRACRNGNGTTGRHCAVISLQTVK